MRISEYFRFYLILYFSLRIFNGFLTIPLQFQPISLEIGSVFPSYAGVLEQAKVLRRI